MIDITPDGDRRRALAAAARLTRKADDATRLRDGAITTCVLEGCSLREISAATGIPHSTIKNIAARVQAAAGVTTPD